MKSHSLLAASTLLLASTVASQLPQNPLQFHNGSGFAHRGALQQSPGHLSQALTFGQTAGLNTLTKISYVIQDQNAATPNPWSLLLGGLGGNGLPNYAAAAPIAGPLTIPISNGIAAYLVTHTFTTQGIPLANPGSQVHICWQFLPSPGVAELHLHASIVGYPSGPCSGAEIQRVEAAQRVAEDLAWSETPPPVVSVPQAASYRLELGFAEPTLQGAALPYVTQATSCLRDPGYAALDPDFADLGPSTPARYDDYEWTITGGGLYANGIAVLFHSQTVLATPVPLPGIAGSLYLDPLDPLFSFVMPTTFNTLGEAKVTMPLGPGTSPLRTIAGSIPSWSSQAIVLSRLTAPSFTQLWTMRPRLAAPGFTAGRATRATPLRIPRVRTQQSMEVRNDGRGVLTFVTLANTVSLTQTSVAERTMQRIPLPAATTNIEFRAGTTGQTTFYYR